MNKRKLVHAYEDIISMKNLLSAWREFLKGKRNKKDVLEFQYCLADNILSLHDGLKSKAYRHGGYHAFNISDPKPRSIHKASVRDRLLHHAIYRILYPFFDQLFISDSFSCRKYKGTHRALLRFQEFGRRVGKNNTKTVWVLKCDVRKFFASIDQRILMRILESSISDPEVIVLISEIVGSFHSARSGIGLPLGNLTSQLLVNIYMNKFDQFVKHRLKVKCYIRYADDFVLLSRNRGHLEAMLSEIKEFLRSELSLELHPDKVFIKTLSSGIDFLGWVHFPDHRVLRTVTKKRMFRSLERSRGKDEVVQSYLGLLSHGNAGSLARKIKK